jgi:hypothetical protein
VPDGQSKRGISGDHSNDTSYRRLHIPSTVACLDYTSSEAVLEMSRAYLDCLDVVAERQASSAAAGH